MKIFSDKLISEACLEMHVADLSKATIGDMVLVAQYLQKKTGIPFVRMDQGSPGLPANRVGIEAEKKALDSGVASVYPAADGIPELKSAASDFIKAYMDLDIPGSCIVPTTGSVAGAFASFIACTQRIPGKDKVLLINPGFPINKSQLRILGIEWREFDIYPFRGEKLEARLEEEFSSGDIAAVIYSNPNNPAWICLDEQELSVIGKLATKYDAVVLEDAAYFCMDYRTDFSHPYKAPYLPSVARYTDNYILLLSASKIFSYAGQRIALSAVSPALFGKHYDALEKRYCNSGVFGPTFVAAILYMITSGCTYTTQMAYAEMLRKSCTGEINFVEDTREYERRARRMKDIFLSHGFHIVYDRDIDRLIGDGFFFSLGYGDMTGSELVVDLMSYGVSSISLSTTGSLQQGIRACVSRITEESYSLLEERMAEFEKDHPLK